MHRSLATLALASAALSFGCGGGADVLLGGIAGGVGGNGTADGSPVDGEATDLGDMGMAEGGMPDGTGEAAADAGDGGGDDGPRVCNGGEPVPLSTSAILDDVVGFGRSVTGGISGCLYHVTSLADSGPGTLRAAAESPDPAWIVFDLSGDITLQTDISVRSDKTIDGRGQAVTVREYGLKLGEGTSNVVIENLSFASDLTSDKNDAIAITNGAHTVWIDHCSFSGYGDGLIDVSHAVTNTDITVSWCAFTNHKLVMLLGNSPSDTGDVAIRATVHHNWWNQIGNYAPRLRFGWVHFYNNFVDQWKDGASAVSMDGQLYSEANVFNAASNKHAISTSPGGDTIPGNALSVGDLPLNGALFEIATPPATQVFAPSSQYPYAPEVAGDALVAEITAGAGAH